MEKIIESLNDKYSSNFDSFKHDDKNVKIVYREIDRLNEKMDGGKLSHVARPSKVRKELNESMRLNLSNNLMHKAILLYEDLLSEN